MKLFLLIGQSNMAGRGDMGEVPPISNGKCRMFRQGSFQPMMEPIHVDRPIDAITYGIGPGASFAVDCAEYFGEEIGLIPCAMGGSPLARWMPGEDLYDFAVANVRLALRFGELTGILWHQGESDSSAELGATYGERFERMVTTLRRDLQTDVPLIVGEISDFSGTAVGMPAINAALHRFAESNANAGIVSAEGLTSKEDKLHYDSVSQREFGHRYFAVFREVWEHLNGPK